MKEVEPKILLRTTSRKVEQEDEISFGEKAILLFRTLMLLSLHSSVFSNSVICILLMLTSKYYDTCPRLQLCGSSLFYGPIFGQVGTWPSLIKTACWAI